MVRSFTSGVRRESTAQNLGLTETHREHNAIVHQGVQRAGAIIP